MAERYRSKSSSDLLSLFSDMDLRVINGPVPPPHHHHQEASNDKAGQAAPIEANPRPASEYRGEDAVRWRNRTRTVTMAAVAPAPEMVIADKAWAERDSDLLRKNAEKNKKRQEHARRQVFRPNSNDCVPRDKYVVRELTGLEVVNWELEEWLFHHPERKALQDQHDE
ncbi:hypothetical protein EDD11_008110 [Mortierella claussenii]|nr:hypothetical protein EDD11_008110 [Mortierella claussenii]